MLTGYHSKWRVSNEEKEANREAKLEAKDAYEMEHRGQFELIYPPNKDDEAAVEKYERILNKSREIYEDSIMMKRRDLGFIENKSTKELQMMSKTGGLKKDLKLKTKGDPKGTPVVPGSKFKDRLMQTPLYSGGSQDEPGEVTEDYCESMLENMQHSRMPRPGEYEGSGIYAAS